MILTPTKLIFQILQIFLKSSFGSLVCSEATQHFWKIYPNNILWDIKVSQYKFQWNLLFIFPGDLSSFEIQCLSDDNTITKKTRKQGISSLRHFLLFISNVTPFAPVFKKQAESSHKLFPND